MDELVVQVEPSEPLARDGGEALDAFRKKAAVGLQRGIGVRTRVEVVEPHTFPRSEHKARRVIDDRKLFTSLKLKLEG
jgi:phenylacetate-CoA ligase